MSYNNCSYMGCKFYNCKIKEKYIIFIALGSGADAINISGLLV